MTTESTTSSTDAGKPPPRWLMKAVTRLHVSLNRLFGGRRHFWPEARRYSKLASVLRIPQQPTPREIAAYLAELESEISERGSAALLAEEPELTANLPR